MLKTSKLLENNLKSISENANFIEKTFRLSKNLDSVKEKQKMEQQNSKIETEIFNEIDVFFN
jgi:hypothetical protein